MRQTGPNCLDKLREAYAGLVGIGLGAKSNSRFTAHVTALPFREPSSESWVGSRIVRAPTQPPVLEGE